MNFGRAGRVYRGMLFRDLRHAARLLARNPGSTAIAALSVAIGLGANTAIFTVEDALLWRPLPVRDPDRVVTVALIGLYGLIAYSVAGRTREIGIRMAIGAARSEVLRMVLRQAMTLAGVGIAIGAIASIAFARVMASAMQGLGSASTPATLIGVPVAVVVLTLVASYIPARHASQVDPLRALRYE